MRGIAPDFGDSGAGYPAKLAFALDRFARIAPRRAAQYRAQASTFEADALFLKGTQLVDVPDSQHLALPNGCAAEQVVIQKDPDFPEDKRYTVNQDLWDRLTDEGRAGLVLHEVIFREALTHGHRDSVKVRYFNSYLTAGKLNSMTSRQIVEFYQRIEFPTAEVQGGEFYVGIDAETKPGLGGELHYRPYSPCGRLEFHPDGHLKRGLPSRPMTVRIGGADLAAASADARYACYDRDVGYEIEFWEAGTVQAFIPQEVTRIPLASRSELIIDKNYIDRLELTPSQGLAKLRGRGPFLFRARGREFLLNKYGISGHEDYEFSADGNQVRGQAIFTPVQGKHVAFVGSPPAWMPPWDQPVWTTHMNSNENFQVGAKAVNFIGPLSFLADGSRITRGCLLEDALLPNLQNRQVWYRNGCTLQFDELGRVSAVEKCGGSGPFNCHDL
jgi:hypothetical protein